MAKNSNVPRSQEDSITRVSEEIEGKVTKNLSQEFSGTKSRILGVLSRLEDFLMNPLIQGYPGTAAETSRNALVTNQGTNETMQNSGPEDGHDNNEENEKILNNTNLCQRKNTWILFYVSRSSLLLR